MEEKGRWGGTQSQKYFHKDKVAPLFCTPLLLMHKTIPYIGILSHGHGIHVYTCSYLHFPISHGIFQKIGDAWQSLSYEWLQPPCLPRCYHDDGQI